jgi:hypothetical protein
VVAPASQQPVHGLLLRRAGAEDALCLSVLAMQVFLDTYATEGIRAEIAREVVSSYSEASFNKALQDEGTYIEVAEVYASSQVILTPPSPVS